MILFPFLNLTLEVASRLSTSPSPTTFASLIPTQVARSPPTTLNTTYKRLDASSTPAAKQQTTENFLNLVISSLLQNTTVPESPALAHKHDQNLSSKYQNDQFPGCLEFKIEGQVYGIPSGKRYFKPYGGPVRATIIVEEDGKRTCKLRTFCRDIVEACKSWVPRCKRENKLSWRGNQPWYYSEQYNLTVYPWLKGEATSTYECNPFYRLNGLCIGWSYKIGQCLDH